MVQCSHFTARRQCIETAGEIELVLARKPCRAYVITKVKQSCIFRVVQVIKSLQDPLKVGNNLPGVNDNVRERGLEQKCF